MYYVYIIKCNDESLYTGYTNNIKRRIKKHNEGKGAKYTRGRAPVELKYYEEFENKSKAMKREYEIKQFTHQQKKALYMNK